MASGKPPFIVVIHPEAQEELDEIWVRNVRERGFAHAEAYDANLKKFIEDLSTDFWQGKEVEAGLGLWRMIFRKRSGGHGHVVVYWINKDTENILVVHIYHSRMDILGRLGQ